MRSGAYNWSFEQDLAPMVAFLAEAGFDGRESLSITDEEYSLGIVLYARYMDIEEADPAAAVLEAGGCLFF